MNDIMFDHVIDGAAERALPLRSHAEQLQ